jgi:hypothetical protein
MPLFEQFSARIRAISNPPEFVIQGARQAVERAGVDWADASGHVMDYERRCAVLLRNFDYASLPAEVERLERALREVAMAPRDEAKAIAARESVFNRGERAGWISKEVDFAMAALQPGESLTTFSFDRVVTSSGRELDRAALRAGNRPPSWSNDATWNSQFLKIERVEERQ